MFEEYENKYIHFNDGIYDTYMHFKNVGTTANKFIDLNGYIGLFIHNDVLYIDFDVKNHGTEIKYLKQAIILDKDTFERTAIRLIFTHEVSL